MEDSEGDFMIVQEILTNFQLLVDSLEQPIDRPSDNEEQKKFYSGKKKKHTLKSQLVGLPNGKDIVDVAVGFPGPTSDINAVGNNRKNLIMNKNLRGIKDIKVVKILRLPIRKNENSN
jgi:hypothetical protein